MRKKGFTLVEVMAVLAITSLLIIAVGGVYLSGIKTTDETKAKTDIENEYRKTYDGLKGMLDDSSKVQIVSKNLEVKNSKVKYSKSLLIYKKENKIYIIGETESNSGVFSIYNIEVKKVYSNTNTIEIESNNEKEISKNIENITFSDDESEVVNGNFINGDVKFKVKNIEREYKFNIDISGSKEINLDLEDKNAGYTNWDNGNMMFANFNVVNRGDIRMGNYGSLKNCSFNINGYDINDIRKNVRFIKNGKPQVKNITSIQGNEYNSIPDFSGDDASIEIEAEELDEARHNLQNGTYYIVKDDDYNENEEAEFTKNKPKDVKKIVGILKPLTNNRMIMIIDGNVNFVSDEDDDMYSGIDHDDVIWLNNIAIVCNGDIRFTNCPIVSNNGIFELIANNNITIANTKVLVDIKGKNNQNLDAYFNKELMGKEVDDFAKLKNGLE